MARRATLKRKCSGETFLKILVGQGLGWGDRQCAIRVFCARALVGHPGKGVILYLTRLLLINDNGNLVADMIFNGFVISNSNYYHSM
jgi:hypothetical protein